MRETKQAEFEAIIKSGNLRELQLFQINDSYFEFEETQHWLIDGGIQLIFPKGVLTFGWNRDLYMFVLDSRSFGEVYSETNYKKLAKGDIYKLHNLSGKGVENAKWKWASFEVLNRDTSEFDKAEAVLELILEFNTGEVLQIAAVNYDLTAEDDPIDYRLSLDYELLIGLDNTFELAV